MSYEWKNEEFRHEIEMFNKSEQRKATVRDTAALLIIALISAAIGFAVILIAG